MQNPSVHTQIVRFLRAALCRELEARGLRFRLFFDPICMRSDCRNEPFGHGKACITCGSSMPPFSVQQPLRHGGAHNEVAPDTPCPGHRIHELVAGFVARAGGGGGGGGGRSPTRATSDGEN